MIVSPFLVSGELGVVLEVLTWLGVAAVGVWTTPRTWVAGEIVTAALMNVHVRDNLADLNTRMDLAVQEVQEEVTALDGNGSIAFLTEATTIVLNGAGAADVNGMSIPPRAPWQMVIVNITASTATLKHEDSTETTPAKRFILPNDTDLPLGLGDGLLLKYISVTLGARWVSVVAA